LLAVSIAALLVVVSLGSGPASGAIVPEAPDWQPCHEGGSGIQCASLVVPVDHDDAASTTVRLSVRRMPAADEDRRVGVLVVIAGGPGQRGTDLVRAGGHLPELSERFDIVGWDQRGTSGETRIECIPQWDPFGSLDRTPDDALEWRHLDERTAQLAAGCRRMHGGLLPYLGTLDSVLDLERLRKLLGEERISLLASSYGTQIALLYAAMFPQHVRGVVLDGLSDPYLAPDEREVVQAAAFERELDALLSACARDRACPFHSAGAPHEALDRLLDRLDDTPVPLAAEPGRYASEADAYEAILGSLVVGPGARNRLLDALAAVEAGDGGPLARIADSIRRAFESSGLDQGTFMASYCADTAGFWSSRSQDELAELSRRIREAAPRLGRWLWSPPTSDDLPAVGLCAMTPAVPPRTLPAADAAAGVPMLVLGTSGDPTTPIDGARRAIERLEQATLLELEADHHLAYTVAVQDPDRPAHRCVLDAVLVHLTKLERPPDGIVCREIMSPGG
jgi:pimeloyl-ACP methyl ester carboxylesterase